jgi:hypothetical protein
VRREEEEGEIFELASRRCSITRAETLNEHNNAPPLFLAAANRDMLYTRNESLRSQDGGFKTRKQRLPPLEVKP